MTIYLSGQRVTIVVSYTSYCGLSRVTPIIDPFMRKMDGVTAENYRAILAAVQTARQINRGTALPEQKTPSIHSRCICHTDPPVMQMSGLPPLHWVDVTRVTSYRRHCLRMGKYCHLLTSTASTLTA
jgi:hypothetical protein